MKTKKAFISASILEKNYKKKNQILPMAIGMASISANVAVGVCLKSLATAIDFGLGSNTGVRHHNEQSLKFVS